MAPANQTADKVWHLNQRDLAQKEIDRDAAGCDDSHHADRGQKILCIERKRFLTVVLKLCLCRVGGELVLFNQKHSQRSSGEASGDHARVAADTPISVAPTAPMLS